MAKNNLIGLVTGFFSSNAEISSGRIYNDEVRNVAESSEVSATGVAKYLESHKGRSTVTGVSKYLKKQESVTVSGVAKYLIRQSISERSSSSSVSSATGVEKYLRSKKDVAPVVRTGVSKYLDGRENIRVSRVTKYVVMKNLAEKNKPVVKTTKVASYLETKKEHAMSGVAKYLTRQMIAEKRAKAEAVVVVKALTSVDKYLLGRA